MSYLYENLAQELRDSIRSGTLKAGERLPSLRQMSRHRGVSLATVMEAYSLLEAEGQLETRPQSGFYVRRSSGAPLPQTALSLAAPSEVRSDRFIQTVLDALKQPGLLMLGSTSLDASLLPNAALARHLHQAATKQNFNLYEDSRGHAELRRQIALRSLDTPSPLSADELVISAGCIEAITLSLRCVARPGDIIAVESPVFYGILQTIEGQGMRALEIPADPLQGLDLELLAQAIEAFPVRALVTVPSFHNPLGYCMPSARKQALVDMLTRRGIAIIEDDIYGEFYYDYAAPPPTLRSFDRTGLVMLCSSFSKTLAPGLRIGWAAPGRFYEEFLHQKRMYSVTTATLPQMALATYLRRGAYERHLRSLRRTLQANLQRLGNGVEAAFPAGTRLSRPVGGTVLWVEMPVQVQAMELFQQALAHGIAISPGPLFALRRESGHDFGHCLRLSCGLPWNEAVDRALVTLGGLATRLAGQA